VADLNVYVVESGTEADYLSVCGVYRTLDGAKGQKKGLWREWFLHGREEDGRGGWVNNEDGTFTNISVQQLLP
jgi:hypothetical protein